MKENHVNAVAVISRTFHPDQHRRQKISRFCNHCHRNGHILNWCRRKMRDGEVQKIRSDMSSKRNISPIKNSCTKKFNRRPPNDNIINNFLDLDDRSNPTIERLSNEGANWQHEAEQFSPPERRFFPRNNCMSFNMAEVKSIGQSDGEWSNHFLWATEASKVSFVFSFYILFKLFIF